YSRRRRHTKSKRDWSSDVCSSDLETKVLDIKHLKADDYQPKKSTDSPTVDPSTKPQKWKKYGIVSGTLGMIVLIAVCSWWFLIRSEERRVGREWTSRRVPVD